MSVNFNNTSIHFPQLAKITHEENRCFGRRFEIKGIDDTSVTTTMHTIYKSACSAYEANNHDQEALQDLKVYIAIVLQAETDANTHYADAGCMYDFRTFFHRLFGGAFFGSHTDRLNALNAKIEKKIRSNHITNLEPVLEPVEKKNIPTPVGIWNHANQFKAKVFDALPTPKNFEGEVLSNNAFETWIATHKGILNIYGSNTHGNAIDNLRDAFKDGQGNTLMSGKSDLVPDKAKNKQLHRKVQEILTLISQKDVESQQELMHKLGLGFSACNTGRINVIEEMHDHLLFKNSKPDFEGRIKLTILAHKQELFNQIILEKSNPHGGSSMQFPHMSSGYLEAVGKEIGLSGILNAGSDPHKRRVDLLEKQQFMTEYHTRFAKGLDALIIDLANEINNINGSFNPTDNESPSFGSWLTTKVNNGSFDAEFALYGDEDKTYEGLRDPTQEQKDYMRFYISNMEVKHILGTLDYLQ